MIRTSVSILALASSVLLCPRLSATPSTQSAAVAPAEAGSGVDAFFERYPSWQRVDMKQAMVALKAEIAASKKSIEAIATIPADKMSFENTFAALESADARVDTIARGIYHLSAVADSPTVRQGQEEMELLTTELSSWTIGNQPLWQALKTAAAQPWVAQLSPSKQLYVRDTIRGFELSGADLPADKKKRVDEIKEQLAQLGSSYAKNMLDSTNAWEKPITDKSQLAGMSEEWLRVRAQKAREKGFGTQEQPQWLLGLDESCTIPILDLCDVEATRRLIWEALGTVGKAAPYDNAGLVEEIITLRQELARLLGFENYAEMVAVNRMVDTGKGAMAFIDNFVAQIQPSWAKETEAFLSFVSEQRGEKVSAIQPWNLRYYRQAQKEKLYQFDGESMRPYFPADKVIAGSLRIFETLFDITIKQVPSSSPKAGAAPTAGTQPVWHPDVTLYDVYDNQTKAHLGSFYLDLYPRSTKRSGGWCMGLRPGDPAADGQPHTPHLAAVVCNFTPPQGDKPALFNDYEVTVLLHEFGHLLHNMLSDVELRSHSGTAVARDFVELPSQLFEFWLGDERTIPLISGHYQTGEPMPAEMVKRYLASRYFMPADANMRQLSLAKLDMELYTNFETTFKGQDLDAATAAVLAPLTVPLTQPSVSMLRRFPHIINLSYGASYYSYKWAEVLCADAYSRFKNEGMLNPKTGADLRRSILSKGGSAKEADLFRDFMGRDPKPDALLEEQGLKAPTKQ